MPPLNCIAFGPFQLYPPARRLELDGVPVRIGSRALDILICLAERPGQPVSNKELIQRVWRGLLVVESSLRVNILKLRKVLQQGGKDSEYIVNIAGCGYCFLAPDVCQPDEPARFAGRLPMPLREAAGCKELVPALAERLRRQRFVTLLGPGGIGKTTVAVAVANVLRSEFQDAAYFIDLASLAAPELLADTVLATFGLAATADPLLGLCAWLQERKCLMVLDNCEHLIDAVADLAGRLYQAAPGLHILATSREAMRVRGEYTHRLQALACPPETGGMSVEQALAYPAFQLFVERAVAGGAQLELNGQEVSLIARLCRNLDGIPLGITLFADRAAVFGVRGTVDLLHNGMLLSCQGTRDAPPRHRTLAAVLDWSYERLPAYERTVLQRLSVFPGWFSLDSALQAVSGETPVLAHAAAAIERLVEKSLVNMAGTPQEPRYSLLEHTRAYAARKLDAVMKRPSLSVTAMC